MNLGDISVSRKPWVSTLVVRAASREPSSGIGPIGTVAVFKVDTSLGRQ